MTRRLLTILAALALLVVACGDDDDTAADTGDDTTAEESPPDDGDDGDGGGDDGGGDAAVTIQNFSFEPASIEVAAGTSITWTNDDGVTHTVTSGTPGEADGTFDESLDAGASADITVDEAGTYDYFCAIHPDMTAEVVVS